MTPMFRIAVLLAALVSAGACAGTASSASGPWAEFMHADGITGWLDTSRVVGDATGPVEVPLRIEYGRSFPVPHDSVHSYRRMDWLVEIDCAKQQLRDRGFTLYDAADQVVGHWRPGNQPWVAFSAHPTGTTVPWACRKLRELGLQPPAA